MLEGCNMGLSKEAITKSALKKQYNEEFNVYEIKTNGSEWDATVSPISNSRILFKAHINQNGTVESDDYYHAYLGYLLEEKLREDLIAFFPDSYIRVRNTGIMWEGGSNDFRAMSIEEIIDNSSMNDFSCPGCIIDIFVDKEIGTKKDYEGEYKYFTDTVDRDIENKEMLPITVSFWLVDKETMNRVQSFFSRDLDFLDGEFIKEVFQIENYERGINYFDKNELGNPPNITACFYKPADGYIGNYNEYQRRREELENVK
jgi:hypothetical protein